ncbi:class I SAM-dependent methyltransferase [Halorussus limi]|uniref:Class I SAM-dependent methyltransferase n=1 Tax=Halorussus limi TaxID=2938695 RepID=A0A8U0HU95_9EURY|nr:class I SAM-dependent methyltransferase [Halorussus limi]UPV74477.1 class I SAM-dependent methyltransferase [Halorussus limi]
MRDTNESEPSTDGSAGRDGVFTTDDAVELYTDRIEDPTLFPQERKIVERYFADSSGSVLDVGCGVGRVSSLLHERGFDVTGIDVSEPLVEKARSLFPDVEFRVEDVRDTEFDAESFDYAVFSYYGLDYLLPKVERVAALRELYRVLKPAGIVAFSSHNSWSPLVPLSASDLRRAIGDVGDFYKKRRNHERLFSRYKFETVPLGELEVYLSNPVHQWLQLRKCGFTLLDVVGERDGVARFFERDTHYVAKK